MHIVITGGTGFIGRALVAELCRLGYACTVLTRDPRRAARQIAEAGVAFVPAGQMPSCDAVIHLAGEPVVGWWTERKRRRILASRLEGTRSLVGALRSIRNRPHTLLAASAVGFYGDRPGEALDESSPCDPRRSFRAEVCRQWEEAANAAVGLGIRVVNLRIGDVMDPGGGFLAGILPLFRGLGGLSFGNREAAIPWISRVDCVRLITMALVNERWYGPLNVTHPERLTQRRFAQTLAVRLARPELGNLPAWLVRLGLGEFASALLDDQHVCPAKAMASGFPFLEGWADFLQRSFPARPGALACQAAAAR